MGAVMPTREQWTREAQAFAAAAQVAEGFAHTNHERAERRVEGLSQTWANGYDAACQEIAAALWQEGEARAMRALGHD